jgi:hypothetical protein
VRVKIQVRGAHNRYAREQANGPRIGEQGKGMEVENVGPEGGDGVVQPLYRPNPVQPLPVGALGVGKRNVKVLRPEGSEFLHASALDVVGRVSVYARGNPDGPAVPKEPFGQRKEVRRDPVVAMEVSHDV